MTEPRQIDYAYFSRTLPDVVAALRTMSQSAGEGLDKGLVELVKVRASQANGCAFCLQLHLDWARKAGVPQAKLDRVAVWWEAPGFDRRERAALAWTEALTDLPGRGGTEAARGALEADFSSEEVMRLTSAVAAINAWNRIAGPLGFAPIAA